MIDLREKLPCASWSIGNARKRFITVHYNGPAIEQGHNVDGWIEHLRFIAEFHMGPYLSADGIQYHYAVLPDGTVCQTRQDDACLWHCANVLGNNESLAIHFPLGDSQAPTPDAWAAFVSLSDGYLKKWGLSRRAVVGHREWPYKSSAAPSPATPWQAGQSACPGNQIAALLDAYRATTQRTVTVRRDVDFAAVREGPARWFPIAWRGQCKLQPGQAIELSEIVEGERIGAMALWGHWMAAGFVHMSLFE